MTYQPPRPDWPNPPVSSSRRDRGYPSVSEAQANARKGYIRKEDQVPGNATWSRKRGPTSAVYTLPDGTREYILYSTVLVSVDPQGVVTVDNGGWRTPTTHTHMVEALRELAPEHSWSVWGEKPYTVVLIDREPVARLDGEPAQIHLED